MLSGCRRSVTDQLGLVLQLFLSFSCNYKHLPYAAAHTTNSCHQFQIEAQQTMLQLMVNIVNWNKYFDVWGHIVRVNDDDDWDLVPKKITNDITMINIWQDSNKRWPCLAQNCQKPIYYILSHFPVSWEWLLDPSHIMQHPLMQTSPHHAWSTDVQCWISAMGYHVQHSPGHLFIPCANIENYICNGCQIISSAHE